MRSKSAEVGRIGVSASHGIPVAGPLPQALTPASRASAINLVLHFAAFMQGVPFAFQVVGAFGKAPGLPDAEKRTGHGQHDQREAGDLQNERVQK